LNLEMPKDRICLGRFGKVFGLKGEIYFNLYGSEDILRTTDEFYLENGTLLRLKGWEWALMEGSWSNYLAMIHRTSVETFVNQKVLCKRSFWQSDTYTTSELLEWT